MASAPLTHSTTLRVATRASQLAMAQTKSFCEALLQERPALRIEVLPMTTTGDRWQGGALAAQGGDKGLFVHELEQALLSGEADCAVHSLKDLPHSLPDGLELAAVGARADARDTLVGAESIDQLARGARVGTTSLRRNAQLRAIRPDLRVEVMRGNIQTRLDKLDAGRCEALVLAAAGLLRLGMSERIGAFLNEVEFVPCIGQGALGVEIKAGDRRAKQLVRLFADSDSERCARAERHCARLLDADCHSALGARALQLPDGSLRLRARVLSMDGRERLDAEARGDEPHDVAESAAQELIAAGALRLLARPS